MPKQPVILIVVLLALPAVRLAAQDTAAAGPLRSAVSATRPMTRVRAELRDGRRLTGTLLGADAAGLALGDTAGQRTVIGYDDVQRYWRRGRATAAGAIVGGVVGAGMGAFLGLVAYVVCEYDCHSLEGNMIVGGVAGAAVTAAAGAVVGSAIPRWSERWRRDGRPRTPGPAVTVRVDSAAAPVRARRTGELTVLGVASYAGYGAGGTSGTPAETGAGIGAEAGLAFRRGRFAFGPEVGLSAGEAARWTIAGLARVDLGDSRRPMVPRLLVGIGGHSWNRWGSDVQYLTGTVGIGVRTRRSWVMEVRWHPTLEYDDPYSPSPWMASLAVGTLVDW